MAGEFLRVIEAHPEEAFIAQSHRKAQSYFTVLAKIAVSGSCPAADGATARGGETPYERSHRSACFWQKTSTALGRCEQNEDAVQLQNEDFGLWVCPAAAWGRWTIRVSANEGSYRAIRSGAKIGAKT
jgi:hypothetical protein